MGVVLAPQDEFFVRNTKEQESYDAFVIDGCFLPLCLGWIVC